jgi:FdhE protein
LDFLALLADAQQAALNRFPTLPPPNPGELKLCREHGMPLLSAQSWTRNPAWRESLTMILHQLKNADLPHATIETITNLLQESEIGLEKMADRILTGNLEVVSPQELPFVAAALQVYWVYMASALGEVAIGRVEQGGICPVCGSFPNAGIVKSGGADQGLRYLCCSLCASQWHMVRIKCSNCESTHGINHFILDGSDGSVKAESCDDCNSYLKLLYLGKDNQMEAMADDLATLALDMLMGKEGKSRCGPNMYFHPGMI